MLEEVESQISRGKKKVIVSRLSDEAQAAFLTRLIKKYPRPFLIITMGTRKAEILSLALSAELFPAPDIVPGEAIQPEKEITARRLRVLNEKPRLIIAPVKAVMWKTPPEIKKLLIRPGQKIDRDEFLERLVEFGYSRQGIVGERGEFSVRGGIIDLFFYEPVRVEFDGERVESIRIFDSASQRSIKTIERFELLPIVEEGRGSFFEHLDKKTIVFLDEPLELEQTAKRLLEAGEDDRYFDFSEINSFLNPFQVIINTSFEEGIQLDPQELGSLPDLSALVKKKAAIREGVSTDLLLSLKEGDFVVHENYGIGIYRGLHKMEVDHTEQEYLLVEYARNDRLYVPLQQMGLIEKYSGAPAPKIYRLSGPEWKKTKRKVEKELNDLTRDLLYLYAARNQVEGFAFPKDEQWQNELSNSFPYEETPDQKKAIEESFRDMESSRPMDRLICGDVGYGKTEVALRLAFKAAVAGKQTVVLAPTTILCQQHFTTFYDRLKGYPVKIEMLSRFKSPAEQKVIVQKIAGGEIDIIIGTHRLLQKDVVFGDLGLLIIDEEQRFGVAHKEKLKQLRKNIDVATLTATPIPRTLYFSLSGARDMSLINTPPLDRLPIRTQVVPWDKTVIKGAIERELDRGGQAYFVHNYVQTIESEAARIKKLLPRARIAVAHGQMKEEKLARVMTDFQEKKFDVLVCTTIIESGLDIPNVNTMLIDHAERFGLAQLYQLRGRIGRSSNRAYAYLLYHKEEVFTEEALERLKAIQEFKELGSGFRLAMRDLEIRGAGTLLGAKQHGHIVSIGFDMYCDLLEEAVRRSKGINEPAPRQVVVDLKVSAYIPSEYISDEAQRTATYRRLTLLSSKKQLNDITEELRDRYGKTPSNLTLLLKVVDLKISAQEAGVSSVKEQKNIVTIEWADGRHKAYKIPPMEPQRKIKNLLAALKLT